jgi:hypothetical protein
MYDELKHICEILENELANVNKKLDKSEGVLSGDDISYIDKLTHSIKSVKTTIAMMEAEDGGDSGRYMPHSYGLYGTPHSYGDSYRRGRDSMGRYTSRRGYSYDDGMIEELRSLMESAPDERTKSEFRQFIAKMEKM